MCANVCVCVCVVSPTIQCKHQSQLYKLQRFEPHRHTHMCTCIEQRSVFITACLLYLLSLSHTETFCFRHTHLLLCPPCAHLCPPHRPWVSLESSNRSYCCTLVQLQKQFGKPWGILVLFLQFYCPSSHHSSHADISKWTQTRTVTH